MPSKSLTTNHDNRCLLKRGMSTSSYIYGTWNVRVLVYAVSSTITTTNPQAKLEVGLLSLLRRLELGRGAGGHIGRLQLQAHPARADTRRAAGAGALRALRVVPRGQPGARAAQTAGGGAGAGAGAGGARRLVAGHGIHPAESGSLSAGI